MNARRFVALWVCVAMSATAAVAIAAAKTKDTDSSDLSAEAAFREARDYTVRIRTRIETPFIDDERGSFEGAGFLVDARRGWIVTNAHVAGHSPSDVQVAFAGKAFQPAHKIYVDSFVDVAIIAIDAPVTGRPAAPLDPAAHLSVGEPVGAFGHPLGMQFTGTRGIASGYTDQFGPSLLQIDATVDHGNSGGPVIALRERRVVGIATAGAGGDKSDRLNFATPIKDVSHILDLLREGVSPCPPSMEFALLKDEDGRHTLRVARSFDSVRWPFQAGDGIVGVFGVSDTLASLSDLVWALRGRTGGVPLTVDRDHRRVTIVAQPSPRPAVVDRRGVSIDGVFIAPISFDDEAAAAEPTRLMVHSVEPASLGQMLGFQPMDILQTVDGRRFEELDSLVTYLHQRPHGPATIVFRRWSPETYRAFDYHRRELPVEDVQLIGFDSPSVAAK
jgi:S1-C subfamily serine protease